MVYPLLTSVAVSVVLIPPFSRKRIFISGRRLEDDQSFARYFCQDLEARYAKRLPTKWTKILPLFFCLYSMMERLMNQQRYHLRTKTPAVWCWGGVCSRDTNRKYDGALTGSFVPRETFDFTREALTYTKRRPLPRKGAPIGCGGWTLKRPLVVSEFQAATLTGAKRCCAAWYEPVCGLHGKKRRTGWGFFDRQQDAETKGRENHRMLIWTQPELMVLHAIGDLFLDVAVEHPTHHAGQGKDLF